MDNTYLDLTTADPGDVDPALLTALLAAVEHRPETSVAARCTQLWSRSIKAHTQAAALDLALACVDLTTLEGIDTAGRVDALVHKALHPDADDPTCPAVAAVCVHPDLVPATAAAIADRSATERLHLAAVATGFPAGRTTTDVKRAEVATAIAAGADEIDIVIDRGAFLAGDHHTVYAQIRDAADACHRAGARLKTILETGELGSLDDVARAAALACWAGSDFVKTSTGKIPVGATPASTYVLLRTVAIHAERTSRLVGVKAAGGVRSAKDAVRYLVMVADVAGAAWLDPHWFRFGASALTNDLVAQRAHQRLGRYLGPDHFTIG